ncbi:hypothetical protein [Kitasatospora sp. NPDC093558]|uniref:hypothetical protein n=1 Tax=Kitasatospora sp. NPDC093558 TaxID=3155201 RepID=UPI003422E61D
MSGADLIARAAKAGVEVDGWAVMPFDFDNHPGAMVDATVSAVTGLQQTLVRAYGYDADTAWRHSGLSSINGHSDSPDEVVSPADFRAMRDFAAAHHLARFTYWAVNRDRSCAGAFTKDAASACGGIQQDPYAFTKIVAGGHVDSTASGPAGPSGDGSHCPGTTPEPVVTTAKPADDTGRAERPGHHDGHGSRHRPADGRRDAGSDAGADAGSDHAHHLGSGAHPLDGRRRRSGPHRRRRHAQRSVARLHRRWRRDQRAGGGHRDPPPARRRLRHGRHAAATGGGAGVGPVGDRWLLPGGRVGLLAAAS